MPLKELLEKVALFFVNFWKKLIKVIVRIRREFKKSY
jgi:hypothetical protein